MIRHFRAGFGLSELAIVIIIVLLILVGALVISRSLFSDVTDLSQTSFLDRVVRDASTTAGSLTYQERGDLHALAFTHLVVEGGSFRSSDTSEVTVGVVTYKYLLLPSNGAPVLVSPGKAGASSPFAQLLSTNPASFVIRIGGPGNPLSNGECAALLLHRFRGLRGVLAAPSRAQNAVSQLDFTSDTGAVVAITPATSTSLRVAFRQVASGVIQVLDDRFLEADAACAGGDDHVVYVSVPFSSR